MNTKHILIVDDDLLSREMLAEMLDAKNEHGQNRFHISLAENGQEGVQWVKGNAPDLVLMDLEMPNMDGFEACQLLRNDGVTIPIIIITRLNTLEDKIKAYKSGADDFFCKPFDKDEVLAKITSSLERYAELEDARQSMSEIVNRSLVDISTLGSIIGFLQKTYRCRSIESLAEQTLSLMRSFGFRSSLLLIENEQKQVWFDDGIERPIERELLFNLTLSRRIFEFGGNRAAFNWGNAVLLIKNMPDDETEAGAIKDYLAYVMNGVEEVIEKLEMEKRLQMTMDRYKESNQEFKANIVMTLDGLENKLKTLFDDPNVSLYLSLETEDNIFKAVFQSRAILEGFLEKGEVTEKELDDLLRLFEQQHNADQDQESQDILLF